MPYTKTTWVDGSAPAISASNLNKIENGIYDSLRQDGTTAMSGQLVVTSGSATTPSIAASGDSNTGLFFPTADTIAFGEGGTEAMRINSSGNLGIGTTSFNLGSYDAGSKFIELESSKYPVIELSSTDSVANDKILGVIGFMNNGTGVASKSSAQIVSLQDGTDGTSPGGRLEFYTRADAGSLTERIRITSAGYLLVGYTSSNGAYPLQVNGQIFATSATIATSDQNYKQNIKPLSDALSIVNALNPVSFDWKEHPVHNFDRTQPTIGFIAQEVAEVLKDQPYLDSVVKKSVCEWETETGKTVEREVTREVTREISEEVDGEEVTRTITEEITEVVTEAVKQKHTEEFYGIAESNLIAILTKAVQELSAEVKALKAQIK